MIGDNIRYIRKKNGYSQGKLAHKLNVRQASISLWEQNKARPTFNHLMAMADMFSVGIDFFMSDEPRRDLDNININKAAIPIIGEIACGTPITAEQNIDGYADLPDGICADFALRCKGESMAPTFLDGDLVLIRQQPDVEEGQIAVVLMAGEATLKHVYHHGRTLTLTADNPAYAPIIVNIDNDNPVSIQGLAVGYTRMLIK